MIKAIFFDMDGTILNTLTDITNSVNQALEQLGYPSQKEENIRLMLGNGAKNLIKQAAPQTLNEEEVKTVYRLYQVHYDHHSNIYTQPYFGIIDLLKTLKKEGFLLAVVSNKHQHLVEKLNQETFESLFDLAIGEQKGIPIKPAPDMLVKGLKHFQIKPEEAVYIGDSEVDVQTAKNTKLKSIAVTWGFRDLSVLEDAKPNYIAHTTKEVLAIIERIHYD